jgi:hypothetical protein
MDPLSIALAVFGGYQGFKTAKKAHAGLLGQLFGAGLGAFGGSQLGGGITSLGAEMAPSVFGEGTFLGTKVNPFASTPEASLLSEQQYNQLANVNPNETGIKAFAPQNANFQQLGEGEPQIINAKFNNGLQQQSTPIYNDQGVVVDYKSNATAAQPNVTTAQPITTNSYASPLYDWNTPSSIGQQYGLDKYTNTLVNPDANIVPSPALTSDQVKAQQALAYANKPWYERALTKPSGEINTTNALLAAAPPVLGGLYFSGAFNPVPKKAMTVGSNTEVPYVESNTPFYVQNPQTGQISLQQRNPSIEAYNIANPRPGTINLGPYQTQIQQLAQGGLAQFSHFRDGGVNYLPSKIATDENNPNNYVRANGYVADSMQAGNKDEDTMLAQLADGEFVTRTDGVLGAGILAGADPTNENEMKKLGADFFYEQQKRFKRIFDLLDASRKATAH